MVFSNRMHVVFVALASFIVVVSAIDVPKQLFRNNNDLILENESDHELLRTMLLQHLKQLDVAMMQMEYNNANIAFEECIPCDNTTVSTSLDIINDDDVEHDRKRSSDDHYEHRMLALFPKLRENVKNVIQSTNDNTGSGELLTMLSTNSIVTAQQTNQTMGGFFDTLLSNPILLVGAIGLGLLIILPLAILESISISTSTPILCIIGLPTSILFGGCRRRRNRYLLSSDSTETDMRKLVGLSDFIAKYFDPATGDEIIPQDTSDMTVNLREIIQFGLSPSTIGYLNNVTVVSVLNDIATNENTSPLISASIIAITPILMLEAISTQTNTPIKCILGICDRRQLMQQEVVVVTEQQQCEMKYIQCQLRNTFMMTN